MAFDKGMFGGGLGELLGGLFGNTGAPYGDAMKQYQDWANKSQQVQQPYLNAGQGAIGDYQKWLQGQKDPGAFLNNLQKQYQSSPYARYLQEQSQFAGENAASASGLTGSTPFMQQQQQNAGNIAQQGLSDWLQKALGINTKYGQGQNNLINSGQNSANALTNMYGNTGQQMGEAAANKKGGENQDFWKTIGGGLGLIGSFL